MGGEDWAIKSSQQDGLKLNVSGTYHCFQFRLFLLQLFLNLDSSPSLFFCCDEEMRDIYWKETKGEERSANAYVHTTLYTHLLRFKQSQCY